MSEQYTYAVARIRSKETALFSNAVLEQLMGCKNLDACLQFLSEKGWGDHDTPMEAESILSREQEKTWEVVRELVKDETILAVLGYPNLFHNLKAAVKVTCTDRKIENLYFQDTTPSGELLEEMIRSHNFQSLPPMMAEAAKESFETLLHTGDGQQCDMIVDRACLDAIHEAGRSAKDEIIRVYAESQVAIADIKIAVRCAKTKKSKDFISRALAPCDTLNVDLLCKAALSGMDAIKEYLNGTDYAEGAEAISESFSAFERWCDNRIIRTISPQKYNAFTVGPIVAYAIARENEIKTVRIILTGKANELPDEAIRERIREMYV